MAEHLTQRVSGWQAFAALLSFMAGNAVAFFAFGLQTATKTDLEKTNQTIQATHDETAKKLDAISSHQAQTDADIAYIEGELRAHKLLEGIHP